jgi:hypothetical protein
MTTNTMPSQQEEIERTAKEITDKVRYYATPNQYVTDSEEQKAYLEGVSTAIAMLYIDLTGTPKSKGILASLTEAHKVEMEKMEKEYQDGISKIASQLRKAGLTKTADQIDHDLERLKAYLNKFNIEVK